MIRVLQVITRLVRGGAQLQTIELVRRLPRDRFHVDLVAGPPDRGEGDLRPWAAELGIRPIILPDLIREVRPWTDWRALNALQAIILKGGYELVHTHTSKAGILGRVAARRAGVRALVHSAHGLIYDPGGKIPGVSDRPVMREVFLRMERRVNRYTSRMVALSISEAEQFLDLGLARPDQIVVMPNGIAPETFAPDAAAGLRLRRDLGIPETAPVAGVVGRLSSEKGQLELVKAWSAILEAQPGAHLLIAGGGPDEEAIRQEVEDAGLGGRIHLLGIRTDLPVVLAALDVFVLPSLYEGFGIVAAEAMAAGLAVTAFRTGGVPEVLGDTGVLVERGDFPALVAAAGSLLADPARRRALGEEGRKRAGREFDIRSVVQRWADLYVEVLKEVSS